jgi:sigma-B regulation protein RsbU (phosphoserine phosphatase)
LNETWHYKVNTVDDLRSGQVILMGTDGIWEARDPQGRMFGKASLYKIVKEYSAFGASEILNAVLAELTRYQEGVAPEDDITLVVAKIK